MQRGKKAAAMLFAFVVGIIASAVGSALVTVNQLPDELTVYEGSSSRLSTFLPVSVEYTSKDSDMAEAKLFGVVGVKKVGIRRESPRTVLLAGTLFGLKMHSDGVMVVGISSFNSDGVSVNPAKKAGISVGDVIHSVNGQKVFTNSDYADIVKKSHGSLSLELTDRSGNRKKVSLQPKYSDADQSVKSGMWVRDSAAGIGTLTYIDPSSGTFGGLGHGICDADTHNIVPLHEGEIVEARIANIRRGVRGSAGEIRGYLGTGELGELESNTICGTFGRYTAELPDFPEYEVAVKQEIRPGKAKVLCTVNAEGKPELYDIVIDKINYSGEPAKNMMITVTDERLLDVTGGIIQGMSGSPIIQGGKFVGAVTHVFVNNPTCGYAIFAENMMVSSDG